MSENKPVKLSELQLTVMKVLWQHQRLSVSQAQQLLNEQKPMALTTVATLLKRMHEKNIVHAEKQGRQFFYSPAITEAEVKTSMLSNLLNHLFDGNPSELVHHLVAQDEVKQDDIAKIQQLIDQEKSND
ncbi:MAG: BlaI/MecI/CopY family transcriptional regulator [Kangiellaceae bacterium]